MWNRSSVRAACFHSPGFVLGCVCVCVCVWKYYSATKKKEVLPFARTWVDLEGSMLSEMSDREKQRLYYLIYIWNLKTKSKQTHRKRDQDCGCQRQRWRVRKWMRWSKGENPYGFRLFFSPQSIFFINSLRVNFGEARFLNSTRPLWLALSLYVCMHQ